MLFGKKIGIRGYKGENKQTGTQKHRSKDVHCFISLELLANKLKLDPL